MILMMIIPIILTVFPVMLYQVVLLLCKRKSTSTHYFWTYTMMIYVWLVSIENMSHHYMIMIFKTIKGLSKRQTFYIFIAIIKANIPITRTVPQILNTLFSCLEDSHENFSLINCCVIAL